MYTTTFAFAASVLPSSLDTPRRTLIGTLMFATGAIVGWPFVLAIAVPFVLEELFIYGGDRIAASSKLTWLLARWKRMFGCGFVAALLFIPSVAIDSIAYGKLTVVPWNIVSYNIFSNLGPNLYGTSPWYYYLLNLTLNFNIVFILALISLPGLFITYFVDRGRLGVVKGSAGESSPYTILALRLAPFYLWLAILSKQEHKEERFMFPAYSLLCFNAAVALYLIRGWLEVIHIGIWKSPYLASRSNIFSRFTTAAILFASIVSVSRIFASWHYYHAPMTIFYHMETTEFPSLLNATGFLNEASSRHPMIRERKEKTIGISEIQNFDLTVCIGKEWHRFPGSFLVPDGVRVGFIQSEFKGLLPGRFIGRTYPRRYLPPPPSWAKGLPWPWPQTRVSPPGFNNMNQEEPSHYIPIDECSYLVDLDFPENPRHSELEPRYHLQSDVWEKAYCRPFLDAQNSPLITRVLWLPGEKWSSANKWGEYCLLRNRPAIAQKIAAMRTVASESTL